MNQDLKKKSRFLISLSEATSLIFCGEYESNLDTNKIEWTKPISQLLRQLKNGLIYSEGKNGSSGQVEEINRTEWSNDFSVWHCQTENYSYINLDEKEIRKIFSIPEQTGKAVEEISHQQIIETKPERRGALPKYDWDAFFTEIIIVSDLDGLPDIQAVLERDMAEWCLDKWGEEPSQSTIRRKINAIYNHQRKIVGSK